MKEKRYLIPSLKQPLNEAIEYIKDIKKYIYLSIFLFVFFAILGFIFHNNLTYLDKTIEQLIKKTVNLSGMDLISFIFTNNLLSSSLSIFLGIFLGIFPFLNALINGLLVGYVIEKVSSVSGFASTWKLLPHGIFEIPAIFISLGLGFRLGSIMLEKNRLKTFKVEIIKTLKVFFLIIIPLLIIAATIEGLLISLLG